MKVLYDRAVYTDALCYLQDRAAAPVRTGFDQTYLLWIIFLCTSPYLHVKYIYYLDVNFYRYYIGRQDQSVNEEVMIGRIDQQIRVTKLMLGYYDAMKISSRKLRHL